jgi:curli biogenesis system outer membrane secretion channel CsgG
MFRQPSGSSLFVPLLLALLILSFSAQTAAQGQKKPRSQNRALVQEKETKNQKPAPAPANVNKPKKVMITDFDARGIARWWVGNWNIGSLFANSVIGPLSRTDGYDVVERARMNEIFNELQLSESERFSQTAVTKAGRQLGADYILFGFLTDFSRKKGGFGPYKEVSARIAFSARLVDVATGKVYKTAEISYTSPKQRDLSLSAQNEFNPNDPEFVQSLFGKAITETTTNLVAQLTGETVPSKIAPTGGGDAPLKKDPAENAGVTVVMQAKVADVTGNVVTINRGRQHGVREGQFFAMVKTIKKITDPDTGKVISEKTEEIARLKISKVDAAAAEGTLVSGDIKMLSVGTEVIRVAAKK